MEGKSSILVPLPTNNVLKVKSDLCLVTLTDLITKQFERRVGEILSSKVVSYGNNLQLSTKETKKIVLDFGTKPSNIDKVTIGNEKTETVETYK